MNFFPFHHLKLSRAQLIFVVISLSSMGLYIVGYLSCLAIFILMTTDLNRAYEGQFGFFSIALYFVCQVELFALYVWLLYLWKYKKLGDSMSLRFSISLPITISILSVPLVPYFSNDIFSYLAHGYVSSQPGGNPYSQALYNLGNQAIVKQLSQFGWVPFHPESPYGAFWSWLEWGSYQLGKTLVQSMMCLKIIGVASFLGTASLIWRIGNWTKIQDPMLPVIAFLWNPLLIQEFCFEGHNDGLMAFFTLLSLFFHLTRASGKGLLALLGSALIKYFTIVLLPIQVIHHWNKYRSFPFSKRQVTWGLIGIGSTLFILYRPFWLGWQTFLGGVKHFDLYLKYPMSIASKFRATGGIAYFCIFTFWQSIRCKTDEQLVNAFAGIACSFFFFVSPKFFPWYLILPVTTLLISRQPYAIFTAVTLSFFGTLSIPADLMFAAKFSESYLDMTDIFNGANVLNVCTLFFIGIQVYQFRERHSGMALQICGNSANSLRNKHA